MTLEEIRREIDEIDSQIIGLLSQRSRFVTAAGKLKKDEQGVRDPKRVEKVIESVKLKAVDVGLDPRIAEEVYRTIIGCFVQKEVKEFTERPPYIYEALPADAAEIWELQKLAFYPQGVLYGDFTLPPLVQTLEGLILDFKTHAFLKATYEGKITGSVRGCAEGDTCHISRLIVHPDHQNKGIGKRLMRAIEEKFTDVRRYELFTGHKSEKNLALYKKLGYRAYKEKPQGNRVTLICMEKMRRERKNT
jgi:chorismate mutase/ribosomal protein S18 acetylase RimI-like enzyme